MKKNKSWTIAKRLKVVSKITNCYKRKGISAHYSFFLPAGKYTENLYLKDEITLWSSLDAMIEDLKKDDD